MEKELRKASPNMAYMSDSMSRTFAARKVWVCVDHQVWQILFQGIRLCKYYWGLKLVSQNACAIAHFFLSPFLYQVQQFTAVTNKEIGERPTVGLARCSLCILEAAGTSATSVVLSKDSNQITGNDDSPEDGRSDIPVPRLRRVAGLLAFYLSVYRTGFSMLRPLYNLIHFQLPLPERWSSTTAQIWHLLPHELPFLSSPPFFTGYSDTTPDALGILLPDFAATVITPTAEIFLNELRAFVFLMLCVPPSTLCYTHNQAVAYGVRSGHSRSLSWTTALAVFVLLVCKDLKIKWTPTFDNLADPPSRPHTFTIHNVTCCHLVQY